MAKPYKIGSEVVRDPNIISGFDKLRNTPHGRKILGDRCVGSAEESNELLNVVRDKIVSEEDWTAPRQLEKVC